ncbi:hypothetical protein SEUCBS139899_005962 [Sporothrix eucalyptigena]|uniref:Uncharacterized protein n=1 Tax=Sporothrix eucalyptigena TaxID=1812306 RepID=A0ABP0CLG3_9PEZI
MARNGRSAATLDPFIVATGRESIKPEGQTRKYIRSHVMQGKNKGKGKGIKKSGMRQQQNTSQSLGLAVGSSPSGIDYMRPDLTPSPERALFVAAMKSAMYPIERHVGIGTDEPGWLSKTTMCRDTDYAQIVAYSALAFFDTAQQDVKSGHNNQRALIHMTRGIQLLRKRVSMLDFSSTDATIFLALALGMFSEAHDELEAAQKHLSGLFQLVRLRGGIKALSDRRFLQIKCCRLDLAIALRTGNQPLFFADEGDDLFSQASLLSANKSAVLTPPLPFIVDPGMSDMDRRVIGASNAVIFDNILSRGT